MSLQKAKAFLKEKGYLDAGQCHGFRPDEGLDDVARIATRVAVLEKGRLAMLGTPREIFSRGDELEAMGLDVPQTVQLCRRLRAGGMDVPDCLTAEELCDAICAAKGGTRRGNA